MFFLVAQTFCLYSLDFCVKLNQYLVMHIDTCFITIVISKGIQKAFTIRIPFYKRSIYRKFYTAQSTMALNGLSQSQNCNYNRKSLQHNNKCTTDILEDFVNYLKKNLAKVVVDNFLEQFLNKLCTKNLLLLLQ